MEVKSYVEAIESALQRLRGRPLVLSPEDLQRVLSWHEKGIPLGLVLELMDEVFDAAAQRRPRRSPRSLAYLAPAVEEAWEDRKEGRVGRRRIRRASKDPTLPDALKSLAAALRSSRAPRQARETIAEVIDALSRGEGPPRADGDLAVQLEEDLFAACREALSSAQRQALDERAAEEIAPYAQGMSDEVRVRALTRARARLLREQFALPDLSLLPLL